LTIDSSHGLVAFRAIHAAILARLRVRGKNCLVGAETVESFDFAAITADSILSVWSKGSGRTGFGFDESAARYWGGLA
jgi:hypothetical protein